MSNPWRKVELIRRSRVYSESFAECHFKEYVEYEIFIHIDHRKEIIEYVTNHSLPYRDDAQFSFIEYDADNESVKTKREIGFYDYRVVCHYFNDLYMKRHPGVTLARDLFSHAQEINYRQASSRASSERPFPPEREIEEKPMHYFDWPKDATLFRGSYSLRKRPHQEMYSELYPRPPPRPPPSSRSQPSPPSQHSSSFVPRDDGPFGWW